MADEKREESLWKEFFSLRGRERFWRKPVTAKRVKARVGVREKKSWSKKSTRTNMCVSAITCVGVNAVHKTVEDGKFEYESKRVCVRE